MKAVLKKVTGNKKNYSSLSLFQYMRDSRLTKEQRLSFYPYMANSILSFGDINKYLFRENPQQINAKNE